MRKVFAGVDEEPVVSAVFDALLTTHHLKVEVLLGGSFEEPPTPFKDSSSVGSYCWTILLESRGCEFGFPYVASQETGVCAAIARRQELIGCLEAKTCEVLVNGHSSHREGKQDVAANGREL